MTAATRRDLTIEDILRTGPNPRDVWRVSRLMVAEVPRRGPAFVALIGLTLGEVLAQVGLALAAKSVVDGATGPVAGVDGATLVLALVLALAGLVFTAVRQRAQEGLILASRERAVRRLAGNINRAAYEDLTAVPMAGLREILMTDVDFAYRFFIQVVSHLVIVAFWVVAAVAVLVWLSPVLLALLAGLALLTGLAVGWGVIRHARLAGLKFRRLADLSQQARDVVEAERVLVARQFGLDNRFVDRFLDAHRDYAQVLLAQTRLAANIRAWLMALNSFSFVAIVAAGGWLIVGGALDAGAMIAILFVISQLLVAVSQLGDYSWRAAETMTAARRIGAYWLSAEAPEAGKTTPTAPIVTLQAEDISFNYPAGPPVFAHLNVELRCGELACLTGATGAGKTTLALVLAGILQPAVGRVRLNGSPELRPQDLPPGRILYVGNKPILVEGTIRQNLLLDPSDEPTEADLQEFFALLSDESGPLPVDVPIIGPNGLGVSAGQAQLIQLARAYFRDPAVVIFDEATSSLDMETEARVQRALLDWCRQRICLVVSHRTCPWTENAANLLSLKTR